MGVRGMIFRTEKGLRSIAQRPGTLIRLWRGGRRQRIPSLDEPNRDENSESFEVLERFEPASWGSAIYRVRSDSTLQCLDDFNE